MGGKTELVYDAKEAAKEARHAEGTEVEKLREALQDVFDGTLWCGACSCFEPCERLAALGIVATEW